MNYKRRYQITNDASITLFFDPTDDMVRIMLYRSFKPALNLYIRKCDLAGFPGKTTKKIFLKHIITGMIKDAKRSFHYLGHDNYSRIAFEEANYKKIS